MDTHDSFEVTTVGIDRHGEAARLACSLGGVAVGRAAVVRICQEQAEQQAEECGLHRRNRTTFSASLVTSDGIHTQNPL